MRAAKKLAQKEELRQAQQDFIAVKAARVAAAKAEVEKLRLDAEEKARLEKVGRGVCFQVPYCHIGMLLVALEPSTLKSCWGLVSGPRT